MRTRALAVCVLLLTVVSARTTIREPLADVFDKGEAGYFCIKIPYLMTTFKGTLIALAEARMNSCSDYTWTDLVMKRSEDGGATWSALSVLYSNSTADYHVVIGNAAPVQDRDTQRILMPFCRNNLQMLLTYSDDDGLSWAPPTNITSATDPRWKWVGAGPPASLQMSSGRIIVPSYHSYFHYDDGEVSHAHVVYSDDHGDTWHLGGSLSGRHLSNENQMVDMGNNTLWINARTLGTDRVQAYSKDGGETWGPVTVIKGVVEPWEGCEGSTVRHPLNNWLFFSIPNNKSFMRYNMTIFVSRDEAKTWEPIVDVDTGRTAYSALSIRPDNSVGLLYERSTNKGIIFVPDHISYVEVWSPESHEAMLEEVVI